MKTRKLLAAGIALWLCAAVAIVAGISHKVRAGTAEKAASLAVSQAAVGNVTTGNPVFGNSQLILSAGTASTTVAQFGTNTVGSTSLYGTAGYSFGSGTVANGSLLGGSGGTATASGGTGSVPCTDLRISVALSGTQSQTCLLVGSSSGSCTFPVYPTASTSGGTSTQFLTLPATNINQIWVALTNSGSSTSSPTSGTVSAAYAQ